MTNQKKIARLSGYEAIRLSDLSIHLQDLSLAAACIDALESLGDYDSVLQTALLRSAAINFLKCFSESAKFKLSAEEIFSSGSLKDYEQYLFIQCKYAKHIMHDDSSHKTFETLAVLNDDGEGLTVDRIFSRPRSKDRFEASESGGLKRLITLASEWIEIEREILLGTITIRLEKTPTSRLQLKMSTVAEHAEVNQA
jgi:hypothetical protein